MKPKDILNALNDVDEDLVDGAVENRKRRPRRAIWIGSVAAALALVIVLSTFLSPWGNSAGLGAKTLAAAPYPTAGRAGLINKTILSLAAGGRLAKIRQEQRELAAQTPAPWDSLRQITVALLSGEGKDNKLCSPLNLYLGLALLAESGAGRTQEQILSLLGAEDLEALQRDAKALWLANYRNDGTNVCILANSLWLDQSRSYRQETVTRLASDYYASVYQGEMGTQKLDRELRSWLSRQTGGAVDTPASRLATDRSTCFLLLSTVAYRADWTEAFSPKRTETKTFFGAAGDVKADFMTEDTEQGTDCLGFQGDRFYAVRKLLTDGSAVWFFLPEWGMTPETLVGDAQLWTMLQDPESNADWDTPYVYLSVPRLELSAQTELEDSLRRLGITDVFDENLADLSRLTGERDGTYLAKTDHGVSLSLGEDGCRASSYFVQESVSYGGGFTLDRPFLLILTNPEGLPLFCGVVNQP